MSTPPWTCRGFGRLCWKCCNLPEISEQEEYSRRQSMDDRETVPCQYCGTPTPMTGTKCCNNCYEVSSRLADFVKSKKGRKFVATLMVTQDRRKPKTCGKCGSKIDQPGPCGVCNDKPYG